MDSNHNELDIYECLFTWDIYETMLKFEYLPDSHQLSDNEDRIYIFTLWSALLKLCGDVIKKDMGSFETDLGTLMDLLSTFENQKLDDEQISSRVVMQIVKATMYYALLKMNFTAQAYELRKYLNEIDWENKLETSTLLGCKSLSWDLFFCDQSEVKLIKYDKASFYAQKAKQMNGKCALWPYMYARNIRAIRRMQFSDVPTFIERKNLSEAYKLNPSPFFGIKLAVCYKECHKEEALDLYRDVKSSNVNNYRIFLRLALGFLHYKDFDSAEECLDKAQSLMTCPDSMYNHYRGLLFMRKGHYYEAAEHLKMCGEMCNIRGELDYLKCLWKIDRNQNWLDLLQAMLQRYTLPYDKIQIMFQLSMLYCQQGDYNNAALCFKDAINMDPKSTIFDNLIYILTDNNRKDTYNLKMKLFSNFDWVIRRMNEEMKRDFKNLQDFIDLRKPVNHFEINRSRQNLDYNWRR